MRVGVMADSHDRIPAVEELLRRMSAAGVGLVLHAGDYCSPFALNPFRDLNMALAGVFGNNDGDREGIKAVAAVGVGGELYDSPHSVELEGKRLLIVHEMSEAAVHSVEHHWSWCMDTRIAAKCGRGAMRSSSIRARRADGCSGHRVRRSSTWTRWKSSSLS